MPLFHDETTITPFKRRDPIRRGGQQAIIYTADNYHELLAMTKLSLWDDEDVEMTRTVRFSLSVTFQIKLGREGSPTAVIPAHEKLTGPFSLIPGNLGFNSEDEVCLISNKSSDYHPDANALQYMLIVMLYENKFTFADNVVIRLHGKDPITRALTITTTLLRRDELNAELQQLDFYRNYHARKAAFFADNPEFAAMVTTTDAKVDNVSLAIGLVGSKKKRSPAKENIPDQKQKAKSNEKPTVSKRMKFDEHEFLNPFNHSLELRKAATADAELELNISSVMGSSSSSSPANQGFWSQTSFFSRKLPRTLLASPINSADFARSVNSHPLTMFPISSSSSSSSSSSGGGISPKRIPLVTELMKDVPKPNFGP